MASQSAEAVEQPFPLSYLIVAAMSIVAAWLVSVIVGELVTTWRAGAYLLGAVVAAGGAVLLREAIAREQPGATGGDRPPDATGPEAHLLALGPGEGAAVDRGALGAPAVRWDIGVVGLHLHSSVRVRIGF